MPAGEPARDDERDAGGQRTGQQELPPEVGQEPERLADASRAGPPPGAARAA